MDMDGESSNYLMPYAPLTFTTLALTYSKNIIQQNEISYEKVKSFFFRP
jgi:hypothetical protein